MPMNSGNVAATKSQEKALGAFLGAAVGDALGWPNEMPARRVRSNGSTDVGAVNMFVAWHRRSGGQFMPHEEVINAGEYSDDTQLVLCGARSLLHGADWLGHLVSRELPTWRLYQRGGGGATNRAVDLWIKGQLPWSLNEADPKRHSYFNAGGNGVAMRIMPHVVVGARDQTFRSTAHAILLNGITTHGHPRALLGALAFGFALWQAMRLGGTLSYGYLIQSTLHDSAEWSSPPEGSGILAEWYNQAQRSFPAGFKQVWAQTLSEMLALLEKSLEGINAGAISLDSRILQELGCFDRKVNGAGTICAAAAIYLASKYAPDPQNGLAEAATLKGADTDTIASMAACLLGTIAGIEWLQRYRNQLQDENYITKIAQRLDLVQMDQNESNTTILPTGKHSQELDRFLLLLRRGKVNDVFEIPDGRKASINGVLPIKTSSQNLSGTQWELKTDDGQILYVKKLERKAKEASQLAVQIGSKDSTKSSPRRKRLGFRIKIKAIKVVVQNLERSRWFYQDILGLKIARESKTLVNFGELLTLVSHDHGADVESPNKQNPQTHAILCLECSDIQSCHDRLRALVEVKVTPIRDWSGRKAFRCVDMDGNVLEIFESLPEKQQIFDQKP
jgi:ADP-ribosylglycohydrolase/catechol 2,3-dioxygenase-like lactoylglutathione lyase family enzyme